MAKLPEYIKQMLVNSTEMRALVQTFEMDKTAPKMTQQERLMFCAGAKYAAEHIMKSFDESLGKMEEDEKKESTCELPKNNPFNGR
jgi:hypothetical protein